VYRCIYRDWRDQGAGPRLGVVSNFDDQLSTILQELDLAKYFDFILTSHDCKEEKPGAKIFAEALKRVDLPPSAAKDAYHIGMDVSTHVLYTLLPL
jgi:HAD superfamily hydrolase (TIGR01549 family)